MRRLLLLLAFLVAAAGPVTATPPTAWDFTFSKLEGGSLPLADFRGKAVLVVNTASFCGFTSQYEGLVSLWKSYRERGLVVVGVPSNDFNQETGSNGEIKEFCELTYGVEFPMAGKTHVTGPDSHPFYQWAAQTLPGSAPKWNFYKYLVAPDGTLVAAYPSATGPSAPALIEAIEKVLPKP